MNEDQQRDLRAWRRVQVAERSSKLQAPRWRRDGAVDTAHHAERIVAT